MIRGPQDRGVRDGQGSPRGSGVPEMGSCPKDGQGSPRWSGVPEMVRGPQDGLGTMRTVVTQEFNLITT